MDEISARLRQIPGDGVRTGYFWMLVGDDDTVKPDRMILRFLKRYGTVTDVVGAKVVLRALADQLTTRGTAPSPTSSVQRSSSARWRISSRRWTPA
ncbi:hypothetical protein [Cellulosimicrobium cellulans]|uniref:hypothetical protein n=1 Tax=Cellulosimicrobium cellulans TaxID=1710 RepID=UPI001112DD31|nr:hypothetical protein [Cellulosimicrobium cellulans]